MSGVPVGVVYSGTGNLFSVLRGLHAVGFSAEVVKQPEEVSKFDRLVLPGVGAFGEAMATLGDLGLVQPVREHVKARRPLLGLCLGAQLLMTTGTEFGQHTGLGFIEGEVTAIPPADGLCIPHVGWASLEAGVSWEETILSDMRPQDEVYFTHSFVCCPECDENILARFDYGPHTLVAAIIKDNVIGTQFHPELSSHCGLRMLTRFRDL